MNIYILSFYPSISKDDLYFEADGFEDASTKVPALLKIAHEHDIKAYDKLKEEHALKVKVFEERLAKKQTKPDEHAPEFSWGEPRTLEEYYSSFTIKRVGKKQDV